MDQKRVNRTQPYLSALTRFPPYILLPAIIAFFYAFLRIVFEVCFAVNHTFGLIISLVFGTIVFGGESLLVILVLFNRRQLRAQGAFIFIGTLLGAIIIAMAGCSALSVAFHEAGWASFKSTKPLHAGVFADHYLWNLLDMAPGLEIAKTFKWNDPIETEGFWAGLPLLLFRICIVLPFLVIVKDWLDPKPDERTSAKPDQAGGTPAHPKLADGVAAT